MTEMAVTGKPIGDYDAYVELVAHAMANGLALSTEREFLASLDPSKPLHEAMRRPAREAIQWRFAFNIDEINLTRGEGVSQVLDSSKVVEFLRSHKLVHVSVSRKSAFCVCDSSITAGVDDNRGWFDAHVAEAISAAWEKGELS